MATNVQEFPNLRQQVSPERSGGGDSVLAVVSEDLSVKVLRKSYVQSTGLKPMFEYNERAGPLFS